MSSLKPTEERMLIENYGWSLMVEIIPQNEPTIRAYPDTNQLIYAVARFCCSEEAITEADLFSFWSA